MLNWVELSQFRSSWKKSQRNYWKYFTLIASILCCIITSTFAAIVLTISNPSTFTTSAPSVWNRWKLKQSHLDWLYWNIYLLFNCPKRQRLRQRWSKWDWYKNIALDVNTHLKGFFCKWKHTEQKWYRTTDISRVIWPNCKKILFLKKRQDCTQQICANQFGVIPLFFWPSTVSSFRSILKFTFKEQRMY